MTNEKHPNSHKETPANQEWSTWPAVNQEVGGQTVKSWWDEPLLEKSPRLKTTRRMVIGGFATMAGAAALGMHLRTEGARERGLSELGNTKGGIQSEPEKDMYLNSGEIEIIGAPVPPFEDENAQDIAEKHHITTRSLIEGHYELGDDFAAFKRADLLPTHYPMVYDHSDLLYNLADEFDVPVNVIATIVSIESGGNELADSGVAMGLFQITDDKLEAIAARDSDPSDVEEQGREAMAYFTELCLPEARRYLGLPDGDESANVYIRAMAMYNAGPSGAAQEFDDLPSETQQYMRHASRHFQVAEVAAGLKSVGYPARSIVESLQSPPIDALAYAFQYANLEQADKEEPPIAFDEARRYLEEYPLPTPATHLEALLKKHFDEYSATVYTVPLNPALRISTVIAPTFVLGDEYKKNRDVESYRAAL